MERFTGELRRVFGQIGQYFVLIVSFTMLFYYSLAVGRLIQLLFAFNEKASESFYND